MLQNNKQAPTLKLIWLGLLASQILLPTILYLQLSQNGEEKREPNMLFISIFCSVALMSLGLAIWLPKMFIQQIKKKVDVGTTNPSQLMEYYSGPFIIRLALLESITIMGFALAFIHHDFQLAIPFATVGIACTFLNHPSDEKISEAFKGP